MGISWFLMSPANLFNCSTCAKRSSSFFFCRESILPLLVVIVSSSSFNSLTLAFNA